MRMRPRSLTRSKSTGFGRFPEVVESLTGNQPLARITVDPHSFFRVASAPEEDFAEVRGQFHAKRALEIAAAGGHNVLLVGPPGSGKTMLAQRLPGILPDLGVQEALETTRSIAWPAPCPRSSR